MAQKSYDAIIVGGGHNGLTLAAYLQRSGLQVAIFERRHEEGGPVFTSECTAPGFLHNLHANYIAFTKEAPFYHDFGLEKLGARFIYPEAQSGIAFSDGRPPIVLYRAYFPEDEKNYERIHRSISVYSKQDADTLVEILRFSRMAGGAGEGFSKIMYNPPTLPSAADPDPYNSSSNLLFTAMGLSPHYGKGSARSLIDSLFESPELRTLLYRQSEEFGVPLEMMGTGMYGLTGIAFAALNWGLSVGGTHSIAHAMEMAAVREGVHFFESKEVKKIIVKSGKAVGVRLLDGTEIMATKLVASNADLQQTLLGMVGEENLSPLWVKRTKDFKLATTSTLASTAMALHEAPNYKSAKHNPDINKTFYTVVGYDKPEDYVEYERDARAGRIPRVLGAGTWVNSLWDRTYAPKGKHSLTGWFFFPCASALSREEWDEVKATHNDKFIKNFSRWAPNMTRANVIADYFYTPYDMHHEMRLVEGNIYNGGMQPDQLGNNRPFPEAAHYRTEIDNLYICGPYTHPGGGVTAANGYCAFKIIAEDLGLDKFWEKHERGY
jgi:phytoene dehydrogenase-like protein